MPSNQRNVMRIVCQIEQLQRWHLLRVLNWQRIGAKIDDFILEFTFNCKRCQLLTVGTDSIARYDTSADVKLK